MKRRVMCYHRDQASTDGLPPRGISREIAFDVMSKTEKMIEGQDIPTTTFHVVMSMRVVHFSVLFIFCIQGLRGLEWLVGGL